MRALLVATAGLALASPLAAQEVVRTERAAFRITPVAQGLEHPWGLAFLPDQRMLVTERPGRVRLVAADGTVSPPLGGLPETVARGQGGMLDVLLHPEFRTTGLVYLCQVQRGEGGFSSTLVRARLAEDRFERAETLFAAEPRATTGQHFGCRLAFGPDGMIYMGLGDRGRMERSQDLADHNGSLLRLTPDGRVPPDNPFVGRTDARSEIWSWGHRNIQGLAVRPGTGQLWLHEHGAQGGDEVNLVKRGANYGWPRVTHGVNYGGAEITPHRSLPGMEDPVHVWTPSIAPSGLAFYQGDAFPGWRGSMLVGALRSRVLVRLTLEGDRVAAEERIPVYGERIRDVRVGPDGRVYLLTDSPRGAIWRLDPV
ncbi:PQQ-dependent sugar dehydrogenase [Elioraea sp.]|uniref:PQQ-dependent sugar dehydrogenase n=1 Tax=Elioraea sp. TaxID=2185103 RepID=UPI00307D96A2